MPIASPALADGPAMFLGSSIMSFALPYGAFIIIAIALFMLFRARHSGPRLKYLTGGTVTSVMTREPAPAPAAESAPADPAAEKRAPADPAAAEAPAPAPPGERPAEPPASTPEGAE